MQHKEERGKLMEIFNKTDPTTTKWELQSCFVNTVENVVGYKELQRSDNSRSCLLQS